MFRQQIVTPRNQIKEDAIKSVVANPKTQPVKNEDVLGVQKKSVPNYKHQKKVLYFDTAQRNEKKQLSRDTQKQYFPLIRRSTQKI